jgi:hypothetical protein
MEKRFCFGALVTVQFVLCGLLSSVNGQDTIPRDGMELWIRADSVKLSGSQVTELYDLSGKNNNPIHDKFAATDLNVPVVVKNAYNGHPALRFNGNYTGFAMTKMTDMRTIIAVLQKDSTECLKRLPNYATPARFFLGDDATTNFHPEHGCYIYNLNLGEVSPLLVNGLTFKNGVRVADGRKTDFPFVLGMVSMIPTGPVTASTVARDRTFSDRSWFGDICEIIIYNKAIDTVTLQKIHTVLGSKYGIAGFKATPVKPRPFSGSQAASSMLSIIHSNTLSTSIKIAGSGQYFLKVFNTKGQKTFEKSGVAPEIVSLSNERLPGDCCFISATVNKVETHIRIVNTILH